MKHGKLLRRAAALLPFILAMVFASCDNPMEPDSGVFSGTSAVPAARTGKASVRFSIQGGAARTVLPDLSEVNLAELNYTLRGKKDGEAEQTLAGFTGSGTALYLEPGAWSFTLYAENTEKDIVLEAAASAVLAADYKSDVMFTLKPLEAGTGAVNISFNYPAQAGINRVDVKIDGIPEDPVDLTSANGAWAYQDTGVDAKDYFAVFSFYSGEKLAATVSETIQVCGGFTSKKTVTLALDDLKNVIKPEGDTFAEKLQWIKDNAANDTNYLVEVTADEVIAPMTFNGSYTGVSITLIGIDTERIIGLSAAGSMFTVGSGVTLSLENNITLSGRADNAVPLVTIEQNGTLVLNDGAKITGNITSSGSYSVGGVYVYYGTFTMNGGEISGNTGFYSGGVYVSSGTFTMNGGEISGNTTTSSGGGVDVSLGIFTMNGGVISGNTSASYGGGVSSNSTFTMSGGKITGNTAQSYYGGGVYLSGIFTMDGGEISGNTSASYGGGIYVDGTFTMNDGKISDNTIGNSNGGGVYASSGSITMNGGEISGNTSPNSGGGVSGSITMNGGKITGNTAAYYGGGVSGSLTMNGGEITGNIASTNGGGVYLGNGDTFTMDGGTISGNTATTYGGGVYIDVNGVFNKTSGVIYGNDAPLANNATAGRGHAVYWNTLPLYRDSTLGAGDNISTADTGAGWDIVAPNPGPMADGWNSGYLAAGGEQWFAFTASAANQYIHPRFGGLDRFSIQAYDSAWQPVGSTSGVNIYRNYASFSGLSAGQTYYIRVRAPANRSGDYEITLSESPMPEGTEAKELESGWNPGNIEPEKVPWFKFTVNDGPQFMHMKGGTVAPSIYADVYDSAWQPVASYEYYVRDGSTTYENLSALSANQMYYVTFRSYYTGSTGNFEIAVNDTIMPPGTEAKELDSGWNSGSIAAGGEEWFSFTASAEWQFIHFKLNTLDQSQVSVLDSNGQHVKDTIAFRDNTWPFSGLSGLNAGQPYYIHVRGYGSGSGDYEIAVNETPMAPGTEAKDPESGWSSGRIASGGAEWFTFTANAETQFIHYKTVMLSGEQLFMNVLDNAGNQVVNMTYGMSSSSFYHKIPGFSAGQVYYIYVRSYNNSSADLEIGVNDSPATPGTAVTELESGWNPGTIVVGEEQWFRFTASAETQYIHGYKINMPNGLVAYVYRDDGTMVRASSMGNAIIIQIDGLSGGQTYYIKVVASVDSGDYQIALNDTSTPPPDSP